MNKGLLASIREDNSKFDSSLSDNLLSRIQDALFDQTTNDSMSITLYTGLTGMYVFNLCMMGFGTPLVHYTFQHYNKNLGIIVLNLFKKSGMIKAVINTRKNLVEIREGSRVIKTAFKFEDIEDYLASLTPKEPQEFYLRNGVKKYIK